MSEVETSPSVSTNLGDFLLLQDDDIGSAIRHGRLSTDNLTVNNSLTAEKLCGSPSSHVRRTLFDIIRSEEVNRSPLSAGGGNLYRRKDKKSLRLFKEMIRTQVTRIGNTTCESSTGSSKLNTWSEFSSAESSQEMLTGNGGVVVGGENGRGGVERGPAAAGRNSTPFGFLVPILIGPDHQPDGVARGNLVGGSELTRFLNWSSREVPVPQMEEMTQQPMHCLSAALAEERDLSAREVLANEGAGGGQSSRMSLMDLLEETDRQMGFVFSKYPLQQDDRKDENSRVGETNNCCVCMVRHKGAAFIPCGHTFCRLCSRELWVSRRACPICNGCILEILDIF